ncbi:WD repeat-containing protein 46 [Cydia pomonella]|uniref:WD repeat-containing protein 46 n=1 Tax=Cydia pomonella TaxID=82600 RepID=UPI002ADD558F|nr:WD repeat-containing protein 46 [Cydia pomonella]
MKPKAMKPDNMQPKLKENSMIQKPKAKKKRYFEIDANVKNVNDASEKAGGQKEEVYNVKVNKRLMFQLKHKQKNQEEYANAQRNKPVSNKPVKNRKKKYPGKAPVNPQKLEQHSRGEGVGKGVRHPLHAHKLKKKEKIYNYAQEQAARAEILLTEEQGYVEVEDDGKTTAITQDLIRDSVDITAATKIFDLNMDFGPYRMKYTRNGRHLLLGGKKGHLAAFDWVTKKLHCEINVMESIHDVSWLHVETMIAVAQKEWLYIYDNNGIELHCVKRMDKILRMEFLPYHFLLAGVNEFGFMTWLDVSIGEIVGHYHNHLGRTSVMTQNPYNGTLCIGNSQGVVSLWSPTVKDPLAKILCHKSPLTAIAVDNRGMYMATSGVDRSLKIYDIRNLDGPVQHYKLRSAPVDLTFSQKDMLAVGLDNVVEVYNNCCTQTTVKPYMRHRMAKNICNFKFCPYEDVLGIGTTKGFTSIIIPGSGEPNFDALESNPFQTKKQRKEAEVKALLEKIPPELITLNPFEVAEVDVPTMKEQMEAKKKLLYVKPKKVDLTPRRKNKGKTNIARKKIIKEASRKKYIEEAIEVQKALETPVQPTKPKISYGVLDRFVSNPKKSKNKK